MQAEEDANADIAAKSYLHTSAYQLIHSGSPSPPQNTQPTSGSAIRQALLRRAKAKELGLDKIDYSTSKISTGQYQYETFEGTDGEARKSLLGTADTKERKHKRHRRLLQKERRQQYNATRDMGERKVDPNLPPSRQEPNSNRNMFHEPPGRNYNPYA